jgi:hypothetical protein
MIFHFKADATFDAENMDDAFVRLATHFLALRAGLADTGLEQTGLIEVKKTDGPGTQVPGERNPHPPEASGPTKE